MLKADRILNILLIKKGVLLKVDLEKKNCSSKEIFIDSED